MLMGCRVEICVGWYCTYVWSQYFSFQKPSWSTPAFFQPFQNLKAWIRNVDLVLHKTRSLLRVVHQLGHLQHIEERLQGFKVRSHCAFDLGCMSLVAGELDWMLQQIAIELWSYEHVFYWSSDLELPPNSESQLRRSWDAVLLVFNLNSFRFWGFQ